MEQTAEFQSVVTNIKTLEQQLANLKISENFMGEAETKIEEHFEQIVNALAARKLELLREIKKQNSSASEALTQCIKAIELQRKILETGSLVYSTDPSTAAHIWQGASKLQVPKVNNTPLALELPSALITSIQTHGKVIHPKENLGEDLYAVDVSVFADSGIGYIDGQNMATKFNSLRGICWNPCDQCFYVCDKQNNAVRKITMQGEVSTYIQGLNGPHGIVIHYKTNTFYISNQTAHTILKVTASGHASVLAGNGKCGFRDGQGTNAQFNFPACLEIDQQTGLLFVADSSNNAIRRVTPQGHVYSLAGTKKSGFTDGRGFDAKFNSPWGVYFDEEIQSLWVCDTHNDKLRHVSLTGEVTTVCEIPQPAFITPAKKQLIVSSYIKNKLFKVTREGNVTPLAVKFEGCDNNEIIGVVHPAGLIVNGQSCYVAEDAGVILKVTLN